MDLRSKVLIAAFLVLFLGATIWKYDSYVVRKNFIIYDHVACDPTLESCFVYDCDPEDEECDTEPFKKSQRLASTLSLCPTEEKGTCSDIECAPGTAGCTVLTCSDDVLEEGELCVREEPPIEEVQEEDAELTEETT